MTKEELVAKIAARSGLTQVASEKAINAMIFEIITHVSHGGKLTLKNFGSFSRRLHKSRISRVLGTGRTVVVPESFKVYFRPGKDFKYWVKKNGE